MYVLYMRYGEAVVDQYLEIRLNQYRQSRVKFAVGIIYGRRLTRVVASIQKFNFEMAIFFIKCLIFRVCLGSCRREKFFGD